jgi:hypothetical protein
VSVTTTAKNDPVVAFSIKDAGGDRSTIDVSAYDSTKKAFAEPVQVASAALHAERQSVSIAHDDQSDTLALVWDDGDSKIMASQSTDGGVSWHTTAVIDGSDPAHSGHSPSIAVTKGNVAISFIDGNDIPAVATGALAGTTFVATEVPSPDEAKPTNAVPSITAVPDGSFGVAYIVAPTAGGVAAVYLPVGGSTPVTAIDSKGVQNDAPSVGVASGPAGPIVGATICNADNEDDACTFAVVSTDGGSTFGAPTSVPPDTGQGGGFVTRVASDGKAAAALAYISNSGNGSAKCGEPKLAISVDLSAWQTCSPDADGSLALDSGVPALTVAPDSSLVVAFQQISSNAKAPVGILVFVITAPSGGIHP